MQDIEYKFNCRLCNFKCQKNSNWEMHLKTKKHLDRSNAEKCRNNAEKNKCLTYKCTIVIKYIRRGIVYGTT